MGFPKGLVAPLQLPAKVGAPLTTEGGVTLDDGNGNMTTPNASTGYFPIIEFASIGNDHGGNVQSGRNITMENPFHFLPNITQPALPANPPVSGTVYQNTTGGTIKIKIPITATAVGGSAQLALGSTATPPDWGGPEDIGVSGEVHNVELDVPNDWYWSVTVASATIGTASVLGIL